MVKNNYTLKSLDLAESSEKLSYLIKYTIYEKYKQAVFEKCF